MIAVSSCLAGIACRYDGSTNLIKPVAHLVLNGAAVCICPECMGGLATPREPAEIVGGDAEAVLDGRARVKTKSGADVTEAFVRGAYTALAVCKAHGVTEAILKARSPSCGCGMVYDGTFTGQLIPGDGVTVALLKRNGIRVRAEIR